MRTLLQLALVTTFLVSCADPGPVAAPFDPIAVGTDPLLDVSSSARIEQGFSMGVWDSIASGTTTTLTRQMLIGDEASEELVLVFDFASEGVWLVDAYQLRSDADNPAQRKTLDVAAAALDNADPENIISGQVTLVSDSSITFWVDMAEGSSIEPDIGVPSEMKPGFVIDGFSFAVQYHGVVDDSRCPPDVTCIWAGDVTLEFSYVDEDRRTSITTTGIATESGPVYGANPTIDLEGGRYLEVLDVTDQTITVVVRTADN